jgi:salicylate hydroxylase
LHLGIEAAFTRCNKGNVSTDPPIWFTARIGDKRKKGAKLGEELFTIPARAGPNGGVHRAQFLKELVDMMPEDIVQFKKRLLDLTEAPNGDTVLHFADGSTAHHSAVLGCDGIKSRVRQIVLGDVPAAKPVFSGKYAYRGVLPMEKAVEILGNEVPRTSQMWLG